jgi:hypothetical protein
MTAGFVAFYCREIREVNSGDKSSGKFSCDNQVHGDLKEKVKI